MLLAHLFGQLIKTGRLTVIESDGRRRSFGTPHGMAVTIRLSDPSISWAIALRPDLRLGEAYTDGRLTVEEGTIYDFLALCLSNLEGRRLPRFARTIGALGYFGRRVQQFNPVPRARRNVAHHYDLSNRLYDLFLDSDKQYSCGFFADRGNTLDQAQDNKKRYLAAKLLLQPGHKVLDIGSGWGGLGLFLARNAGVDVTGVTLSERQQEVAQRRAAQSGLSDHVRFLLRDYREERGTYDRIVSVGMFEHVGVNHFDRFFGTIRDRLTQDGVAVVHSIGRSSGPGITNAWIRKYIFPGGYIPALSEVLPAVERAGLWVTDIDILRLHYADTLREWRQRFLANRDEIRRLYDERFCRLWEFYLASSETYFRYEDGMVFQMQLARRRDAVPLTRDYLADWRREGASRAAAE